jgi:hypothetical protein
MSEVNWLGPYDPGKDDAEAAASRERALLQSIRRWTHLATVPSKDLKDAWGASGCCLCARYRGKCQKRIVCPMTIVHQACTAKGSMWQRVIRAYYVWEFDQSLANFRKYRFVARSMLWWVEFAYTKLYVKK